MSIFASRAHSPSSAYKPAALLPAAVSPKAIVRNECKTCWPRPLIIIIIISFQAYCPLPYIWGRCGGAAAMTLIIRLITSAPVTPTTVECAKTGERSHALGRAWGCCVGCAGKK
jgi:hypothetical protein